jgi:hypothetical protein
MRGQFTASFGYRVCESYESARQNHQVDAL